MIQQDAIAAFAPIHQRFALTIEHHIGHVVSQANDLSL
jgi:hypothetical protein